MEILLAIVLVLAVLGAIVVALSLSDIRRYLRMRRM